MEKNIPLFEIGMVAMYVYEGQERIREEDEYKLYREQYPFEEYYYFKEEFKWE